ncbi:nitroreductase/quinone reductase family protein [Rhodococcus oxybenzonivorans]|uniref:nitroreductase/quinone reductase family protein n=1 Tax=Rhodococcus TaxID=1827 RepID=UPI0037C6CC27
MARPSPAGVPTLLLHTVGRKSGAPRTSALTYGRDGDDHLPGDPDYDRMWATMKDIIRAATATIRRRRRAHTRCDSYPLALIRLRDNRSGSRIFIRRTRGRAPPPTG